jgi:hypothetical protein
MPTKKIPPPVKKQASDMPQGCLTFQIGKVNVIGDHKLIFNELRELCHKDDIYSFKYSTQVNGKELLLTGASVSEVIKSPEDLKHLQFVVNTTIDGKQVSDTNATYQQIEDLFTKDHQSQLFLTARKSLPVATQKLLKQSEQMGY